MRGARVLVVEDNPSLGKYVLLLLTEEGHHPVHASSGEEALRAVAQESFDLVLMDLRLPGMQGLQLLRTLRAAHPDLRVAVMSGDSRGPRGEEALEQGAWRFLPKPVDADTLLAVVRETMGGEPGAAAEGGAVPAPPSDLERSRRLKARYGVLLEAAPDAMMMADRDGRILLLNRQLAELFGYAPEELLGQPVELLVPDHLRGRHPGHRAAYAADPRTRPMGAGRDLLARRRDGSEFAVEISLSPMDSEEGPVVIAAVRDITERRRLEERRREVDELAMRQAQEASRLKSEFLANMSHELRTPLNAILGFGQLLRRQRSGALNDTQRDYVEDILKSSTHLLQIINDVLDLAKVESGRMEFRPEAVELGPLVAEVRDTLRSLAAERRLGVEVDIDPAIGTVHVDPARVKQVLYNFLSNAIKFTDEGGRVVVRARPDHADTFRFEVEDNGVGIAASDLPRLFMEFQQLDAGPGKRHGGTGLGLALSRRIVEGHGGRVLVQSTPGRGSTFAAVLPRVGPGTRSEAASRPSPRGERAERATAGGRILVVDDNPANVKLLLALLSDEGYEVDASATAEDAVRMVQARRPDLILMDLQLPGMNGFELTRRLKDDEGTRGVRVLALTAYAMKGDEDRALGAGCDGYMSKPFDTPELLRRISELLGAV